MTIWILLGAPWALSIALTAVLPTLADSFHPYWRAPVAATLALMLAISTWTSMIAGASILLRQPDVMGRIGGLALAGICSGLLLLALRHLMRVRMSVRAGRAIRCGAADKDGAVVIVEDDRPDAFAVPGRAGGLIVLTTGLTAVMTAAERRAVIDHERAHLRQRHHFHVQAVELAACINPLLRPWTRVVRLAVERSADEHAARGGRGNAARAIARAALLCAHAQPAPGCRITGRPSDVRARVLALTHEAPPRQRRYLLALAAIIAVLISVQTYLAADIAQDHVAPERGEPLSTVIG
ncbi:M48 family metalloprotease [Mycolicibacterium fluoranthenivorans]|uniref:M48 family metalloprotease n=1 Tax=Mycolicibacterium fluoranthenivorans TaxID=258505 RepID=A0A7G8PAP0_9MYCO|nr:M56 family metallopeptidase [Mycolicibacterium fluoranthenivorans]QNJ91406.1 M48 family metalloprotease [Mycolicibacterium fluoranthenivorans]